MSAKRPKGLTRKITLDHALSYDRTLPNRRGVTALAELNGSGAYERRYRRTKRLLANKGKTMKYTARQKAALRRMPAKRRANFKKMLAAAGYRPNAIAWGAESAQFTDSPKAAPAPKAYRPVQHRGGKPAEYAPPGWKKAKGKKGKAKKEKKPRAHLVSKGVFFEFYKAKGWTKSKVEALWKKEKKSHRKPVRAVKRGKYTGIVAQIGKAKRRTYMYTDKKGQIRHMPEWMVLGYKSKAHMEKDWNHPEASRLVVERRNALKAKREKMAAAASKRIMEGRDMFSPNEGGVMSFEEWKKMHANKKRKAKKSGRKGRKLSPKQRAAALRNLKKARAARKHGKTAKKRVKRHAKKKLTKAQRATISRRNLKKARAARKGHGRKAKTAKKHAKRRARKGTRKHTAPKRRTHRRGRKAASPKRRRTHRARRMTFTMYAKNKRRGGRYKGFKGHRRPLGLRTFRRNIGTDFVADLKDALKIGAIVVVGYGIHRALSNLVDEYGLSKVQSLSTNKWRPLLSSALVTLVGVPLAAWAGSSTGKRSLVLPVAAGMAASFLHKALLSALVATENDSAMKVAGYLAAYPDAGSRAYNGVGSYYSFQPRQVFGRAGTGEYYETLPQSGFGLDSSRLLQAAAGFGGPVMQAAAGMGAEVTQAAAGTGEYVVYGAEGIGEYEEVPVGGVGAFGVDDGVLPTLSQAEHALNVAEAAAGIGDLPMRSTVDPIQNSKPIAGEPGGSRAGILNGGDGIFGG